MANESTNSQDARIEHLFRALDVEKKGYLDLENLREGFKRIDHPLKNAENLCETVLDRIDSDHDGQITFLEFQTFVKHMEEELQALFESVDRNHDGELDREELQVAFRRAGLTISNRKVDEFISAIDANHDGMLSFDEWRNFLLFLPTTIDSEVNLENILQFYSKTSVRLGSDSDVLVEAVNGQNLGINRIMSFIKPFFGILFIIGDRPRSFPELPPIEATLPSKRSASIKVQRVNSASAAASAATSNLPSVVVYPEITAAEPDVLPSLDWTQWSNVRAVLIACVPSTGYFAAGAVAGIVSRTATAPLDRLKVYLIAQTKIRDHPLAKRHGLFGIATVALKNTGYAFKDLWRAGGLRSLYAGNGLNIIKVMPETAIRFGFFEGSKRVLAKMEGHNNPKRLSQVSKMVAGGIGGIASQFLIYPLDTLKFRMQCETVEGGLHGNKLIIATARKMWKTGGIRAYYKGVIPGLAGVFPYAGIDMGTFEFIKMKLTDRNIQLYGLHEDDAGPSSVMMAAMGAFTGALGATVVYPVNLVRTRLQSQGTVMHPRTYNGFWDAMRVTVKGEGVGGLFKGLVPNLVKVVPAVSITYVVYENSKRHWGLK